MPQISLRLSKNIDISCVNFKDVFIAIHHALNRWANVDIQTCNSGVICEEYSCIGLGDERVTKVYLEILWLEDGTRTIIKRELAQNLMTILEGQLVPQIEKQNLICVPRVRIGNLGVIDYDYSISKRQSKVESISG